MKKLSIHAFILFAILFSPIFVNAEVHNVTVHGTIHEGNYEKQILDSVNEERRKVGMPELQMDMRLTEAARQRAIEIGTYYDSRHLRTNLGSASSVMDDFGIFYYSFGENIAAGYSNVSTVMNAWITSTPHYNNIVNSRYSAIGIGVYQSIDGRWFWVQNFSNALNNVYTPDTTRSVVGDYSVRYEDTIRSSYAAGSLSDVSLNVGESHTIDFHVTTFNEVTNSNIPLYLLDWESSDSSVCEIENEENTIIVHAKSAGESTIHTTFGGVDYSFVVTVLGDSQEEVSHAKIQVITNYNTSATLLDVDSTQDYSTLTFSVDDVSHNSITHYFEDHTIANPSALDVQYCSSEECNQPIRPIRWQSKDTKIVDYVDGKFIFQNSGQTTITAIFENGIQVSILVDVSDYHFDSMEYHLFVNGTKTVQLFNDNELSSQFYSLNPEIADIDSNGVITAKENGVAMIQAIREDQTIVFAKVFVYEEQNLSINVDRENVELKEDETITLNISSNLDNSVFSYDKYDTDIIDWKEDGTLHAKAVGSTTLEITAIYKVADGLFLQTVKTIPIQVVHKDIDVTDILVLNDNLELMEGEETSLDCEVLPEDATDKSLTYVSSNEAVVVVDSNGKALAISAGEAVITVTATNGISKEIKVFVKAVERKGLQIDKTHIELNVGEKEKIEVRDCQGSLTWISDNPEIASVDENGTILAIHKGSTTIRVRDQEEEVTLSVTVIEVIPITEIHVSNEEITLVEGESTSIDATIYPENTTDKLDLVWMSSNSNVASVDSKGKVLALSAGEADITITSVNGVQSIVHIIVTKKLIPISDLEVSGEVVSLNEGDSYSIIVKVLPEDTTDERVLHYQSSDTRIITVGEDGIVFAIADGQATITITSLNGISKTVDFVVSKKVIPITDISINRSSLVMTVGDVSRLIANVIPENTTEDTTLTWSSNREDVVQVINGQVRAVGVGNAIITVSTNNGISKTIPVVVSKRPVKNEFSVDFRQNPFSVENENGKVVLQLNEKSKSSVQISDNEELLAFYDITYLEGSNSTFENPKFFVSIPFMISSDEYASIYVASIVDGEIKDVFLSNIQDGKIHFTTDHFSEYAVIGVKKAKEEISPSPSSSPSSTTDTALSDNPKTGSPIVIYIVIWIIAFLLLCRMTNLLFQINKKND